MEDVTVSLKFVRITPRKMRRVVDQIRHKNLKQALDILEFIPQRATQSILKLLKAAQAAAKDQNLNLEKVFIKEIRADSGPSLKRFRILHRGRSSQVLKRMSHLTLTLAEKEDTFPQKINKFTSKRS